MTDPQKSLDQDVRSFDGLREIVRRLRAPDGCPWDRVQTHESLRRYLLEETYETLDALDGGNPAKLREELGDVLLQILLHAQIASESGEFTIDDVIEGIATKLLRRHPHVFGETKVDTAEEVVLKWEAIKSDERGARATAGGHAADAARRSRTARRYRSGPSLPASSGRGSRTCSTS